MLLEIHRIVKQPPDVDELIFDDPVYEKVPRLLPAACDMKGAGVTVELGTAFCRKTIRVRCDVRQGLPNQRLVFLVLSLAESAKGVSQHLFHVADRPF